MDGCRLNFFYVNGICTQATLTLCYYYYFLQRNICTSQFIQIAISLQTNDSANWWSSDSWEMGQFIVFILEMYKLKKWKAKSFAQSHKANELVTEQGIEPSHWLPIFFLTSKFSVQKLWFFKIVRARKATINFPPLLMLINNYINQSWDRDKDN